MAWKNQKIKDSIIDILNRYNINYKLEEDISNISIWYRDTPIGTINFTIGVAKKYIVFLAFSFDSVPAQYIPNVLKLINTTNSHLDSNVPYLYLNDNMRVGMKGEMYCGANPDIDTDFVESIDKRIRKLLFTMLEFGKSYNYIQAGYDAETAFRMGQNS